MNHAINTNNYVINQLDFVVQVTEIPEKGPVRTRRIFIYFAKLSVISSILQVRMLVLIPTKFCQTLPNFKSAVVLPQSRTNFCQLKFW